MLFLMAVEVSVFYGKGQCDRVVIWIGSEVHQIDAINLSNDIIPEKVTNIKIAPRD